jgi:hypothetical protein
MLYAFIHSGGGQWNRESLYTYFMISDRNNFFKEMPEDKMTAEMFSL